METNLKLEDMKGKKIKVTYNSTLNEVCRDEGILNNVTTGFITLELYGDRAKFISINKIIRVEEG